MHLDSNFTIVFEVSDLSFSEFFGYYSQRQSFTLIIKNTAVVTVNTQSSNLIAPSGSAFIMTSRIASARYLSGSAFITGLIHAGAVSTGKKTPPRNIIGIVRILLIVSDTSRFLAKLATEKAMVTKVREPIITTTKSAK